LCKRKVVEMSVAHGIQTIERLTEENYEWKIQMRNVLVCNDMWDYINGNAQRTAENTAIWTAKDQKTLH